jgi:hypothetical protein
MEYPQLRKVKPSTIPLVHAKVRGIIRCMDILETNHYPQLCFEAGLTCRQCTGETARHLASVCKGLRGKTIGQMFTIIHPHPACAPMHSHFAERYRAHSGEGEQGEAMARKPAAMAAVA